MFNFERGSAFVDQAESAVNSMSSAAGFSGFWVLRGAAMKKILVTGGAGYVGHMLTPQLLAAGYAVVVYDMMWYGNDTMPKDNPSLTLVEGDIRDTAKLAKHFEGVDTVLRLRSIYGIPRKSLSDPDRYIDASYLSRALNK